MCHFNAGADFQDIGKNSNFDTGTRVATAGAVGLLSTTPVFDGGFGGEGLADFNFDAPNLGFLNSFA